MKNLEIKLRRLNKLFWKIINTLLIFSITSLFLNCLTVFKFFSNFYFKYNIGFIITGINILLLFLAIYIDSYRSKIKKIRELTEQEKRKIFMSPGLVEDVINFIKGNKDLVIIDDYARNVEIVIKKDEYECQR